ncbi:MAG: PemK family transcriptional regulator [Desulfobacterales bacterium CG23_combo_of_CG06-09_8_20_14_all_51_8]|nr:MAG: PemK family transcriptional regulator [Desulfobacterales bacterium CG23_combo_of_CG06-09_8_20_14_all_51_8]
MNRGNVFWVNLDSTKGAEIAKPRPCVLVGATPINRARRTVVVVPLSTGGKPRPPLAVPVLCLERNVIAVCDQIRAVDKTRLVKAAGILSSDDLEAIDEGLRQVLAV